MGLLSDPTGVGAVASLVQDVADKIWPDPAVKAQAMIQVAQLDTQIAAGQAAINQVEAGNTSLFVSGWRPFIGWVCGLAFAYHMICVPFVQYILALKGVNYSLPVFDSSLLSTVLMGMLGLGTLRTVEQMGTRGHLPWQKNEDSSN